MSNSVFDSLELETSVVTMPEDQKDKKQEKVTNQNTTSKSEEGQENDPVDSGNIIELDTPEKQEEEFDNGGDENVDPGINLIYNQLKEFNLIDEVENPEQLNEDFIRNKLPEIEEKVFMNSIENLSPDTKALLQFAFNNQGQDTIENLKGFFKQYIEPASEVSLSDPRAYLKNILKDAPLMSEQDIEDKLEDWELEGVLEQKAQTAYEAKKKELEKAKEEQIKLAEENRQKEFQRKQEFAQEINSIVEQQNWNEEKQGRFIETVRNSEAYNQQITSSPEAYVQLIDFLSYFNPETNRFDIENWVAGAATTKEADQKMKKVKKDLLSTTLGRMNNRSSKKRTSEPLKIVVTPEYENLIK